VLEPAKLRKDAQIGMYFCSSFQSGTKLTCHTLKSMQSNIPDNKTGPTGGLMPSKCPSMRRINESRENWRSDWVYLIKNQTAIWTFNTPRSWSKWQFEDD